MTRWLKYLEKNKWRLMIAIGFLIIGSIASYYLNKIKVDNITVIVFAMVFVPYMLLREVNSSLKTIRAMSRRKRRKNNKLYIEKYGYLPMRIK